MTTRWAIAQPRMHGSLEGNLAETLATLKAAKSAGANGCVCTELTVTGFHRRLAGLPGTSRSLHAAHGGCV
ncbi:MAG: hypothetical protein ACT6S0_10130 [Roseateles sp.]|uniref:hypothetical protein n=1 Tax=Roseateles sp. TaxID=1971397 RepID=UPI0040361D16